MGHTVEQQFTVDTATLHLGRKPGISGIMRVKNDAEFIEASVNSCIDALDELIIVYNGCSDNSPEIIEALARRHPQKVKAYHYEPELFCGALTKSQYEEAKSLPHDSVHLLSNYYNYALAKSTRTHVMKIDADQIYFSKALNDVCDGIRDASLRKTSATDWLAFLKVGGLMLKYKWRPGQTTHKEFARYRRVLLWMCAKGLASVSLSGINVFGTAGKWYVTNGRKCPSVNILPQFNGTNDHLIFKVKPGTKFVPYDCKHYNIQASADYTYIERLVGEPRALPYGFMWWHLNAMRANIYHKQLDNFASTPDGFSEISDLLNLSAPEIYGVLNSDFVSDSSKVLFTFYYAHCRAEIPLKSLSQINLPYSEKPKE